ncbi:MAG TPA: hypothetical protein VIK26_04980 [Clostridium sp.]
MFKKINEDLKICKENIFLKEILERKLVTLKVTLKCEELALEKLENSLDKEYKDVKKLEGISINNIFAILAGNKEEKLSKEQQEYIQAKLKYEECEWKIREYKENLMDMKVRIFDLTKYENEYKKLIEQKSEIIKSTEIEDSLKDELEKEEYTQYCKVKEDVEVKQAITASKDCLDIIDASANRLSSAKKWGLFDIGSDNIIASLVKYERINDSKEQLFALGYSISRLNEELGDINMSFMFNGFNFNTLIDELNIDTFTYKLDVGGNVFKEIAVQKIINNASGNVKDIENKLINLREELAKKEKQISEEIIIINRRIDELIEKVN